jgi:hypothetical protein
LHRWNYHSHPASTYQKIFFSFPTYKILIFLSNIFHNNAHTTPIR